MEGGLIHEAQSHTLLDLVGVLPRQDHPSKVGLAKSQTADRVGERRAAQKAGGLEFLLSLTHSRIPHANDGESVAGAVGG